MNCRERTKGKEKRGELVFATLKNRRRQGLAPGKPVAVINWTSIFLWEIDLNFPFSIMNDMDNICDADVLEFLEKSVKSEKKMANLRRNLTTAFADGVVCAEIVFNYYPKIISLHNYPETSSVQGRKENWEHLNKKVLTKMNCGIDASAILCFSGRESFERIHSFLRILKHKLQAYEPIYSALQFNEEEQQQQRIEKLTKVKQASNRVNINNQKMISTKQSSKESVPSQASSSVSKPSMAKTNEICGKLKIRGDMIKAAARRASKM